MIISNESSLSTSNGYNVSIQEGQFSVSGFEFNFQIVTSTPKGILQVTYLDTMQEVCWEIENVQKWATV